MEPPDHRHAQTLAGYLQSGPDPGFARRREWSRRVDALPRALARMVRKTLWSGPYRHLRHFDHAFTFERTHGALTAMFHHGARVADATPLADILPAITRPVTLVTTGPSALDADWPALAASGRMVVAVTGGASFLRERGITPDLIILSDPDFCASGGQHVAQAPGIPLVVEYRSAAALHAHFPGALTNRPLAILERANKWYGLPALAPTELQGLNKRSGSPFVYSVRQDDLERIGWSADPGLGFYPCSTVAFVALQVLVALGATDIDIIGMDLGGGRSVYAAAAPSRLEQTYEPIILPCFETMAAALSNGPVRIRNLSPVCPLPAAVFPQGAATVTGRTAADASLTTPRPVALVFRKRMLPYSETFIAAQGKHLQRWRPVYAGATMEKSGLGLLDGAPVCILTENLKGLSGLLAGVMFKKTGRIPGRWLQALRRHDPRVLHVHFGTDAWKMGIPLSKALGIPLLATFHGYDITDGSPNNNYARNRHQLFAHAARILAVSDFIAGRLVAAGCPPAKIIRHYIGIDVEAFTPPAADQPRSGVVFVGRLTEKKGCRFLLEAMRLLAAEGCKETLHIIGDGELRRELEDLARPLGRQVVFHGRKDPAFVAATLGRAAVCGAPSVTGATGNTEGLPMVILEAMAMGTPVVSTRHAGIPEAVIHDRTGWLVPEADPAALADALRRCLDNPALAREYSAAALARVRSQFDIRTQCRLLEDIYDSLAGRHAPIP